MFFNAPPREYHELRIDVRGDGDGIQVRMGSPRATDETVSGRLQLTFDEWDVQKTLNMASYASGRYVTRSDRAETLDPLKEMGDKLFTALFEGRRRPVYDRALSAAKEEGAGLRLRFVASSSELEWIPWEFLFDARRPDFVALSVNSPIIRQASDPSGGPVMSRLPEISGSIRAMLVASDPMQNLQAERELQHLKQLASEYPSLLHTVVLQDPDRETLLNRLQEEDFHVLHVVANIVTGPHGEEVLLMPDDDEPVTVDDLRDILVKKTGVRLLLFNACSTRGFARQLAPFVPASLGMQSIVTGDACEAMALSLYNGLLHGLPVEAALTDARQQIDRRLSGSREWGLVTLYLQTENGMILQPEPSGSISADVDIFQTRSGDHPDRERAKNKVRLAVLKQNQIALTEGLKSNSESEVAYKAQLDQLEQEIRSLETRI